MKPGRAERQPDFAVEIHRRAQADLKWILRRAALPGGGVFE
jgi:hypothetical protein